MHRNMRPWLHNEIMWKLSASGREEKACLKILHGHTEMVL